jgi:hypothetical protein
MPNDPNTGDGGDEAQQESLVRFIKATVDEHIKTSQKGQDDTRKKKWKNSWRSASPLTKLALIVSAAVMLATIANSIAAGIQSSTVKRQLKEMQGASNQTDRLICLYQQQLAELKKQAGDTHDLAVAAGKQADQSLIQAHGTRSLAQTSKDALVSVQRAFIFATGFDAIRIGDPIDPNKVDSVEVSITWENNGTTPTRNMSTHYSYLPSPSPQPDSLFFTDLGNTKPAPIALGPKAVGHTAPISIPASTVSEIMDHKTVFYIWGWARYNDIFPKSKRHITRFCTAITGFQGNPLNGNPSAISRPVLANCASNCYDDECKVQ